MRDKISSRQLGIMAFLSLLSPIVRLLPVSSLALAGRAAWLSPLVAAAVACLFALLLSMLASKLRPQNGELLRASLGSFWGGAFSAVFGLWLVFYSGIVLRVSAERLVSVLYPEASPAIFILATSVALLAPLTMGNRTLYRAGELALPLIMGCLFFVLVFSVKDIRLRYLLPVGLEDAGAAALGSLPVMEIFAIWAYYLLLAPALTDGDRLGRESVKWLSLAAFCAFLLGLTTIGVLSPELCSGFLSPALAVVRNISIFGTDARVDSVIVAIWVITDFALIASLLGIAHQLLRGLLPGRGSRLAAPGECAAVASVAFLISGSAEGAARWSEKLAPIVNSALANILLPLVLVVGIIRKNFR